MMNMHNGKGNNYLQRVASDPVVFPRDKTVELFKDCFFSILILFVFSSIHTQMVSIMILMMMRKRKNTNKKKKKKMMIVSFNELEEHKFHYFEIID